MTLEESIQAFRLRVFVEAERLAMWKAACVGGGGGGDRRKRFSTSTGASCFRAGTSHAWSPSDVAIADKRLRQPARSPVSRDAGLSDRLVEYRRP